MLRSANISVLQAHSDTTVQPFVYGSNGMEMSEFSKELLERCMVTIFPKKDNFLHKGFLQYSNDTQNIVILNLLTSKLSIINTSS
jgi:hypothetical protein